MKILSCLILCLVTGSSFACAIDSIPVRYISAIEARNVAAMAQHLADDVHYQDPTMDFFGIPEIDLSGRDAVTKFWADSFRDASVETMDYRIENCFQVGNNVLLDLTFAMKVEGKSWQVNTPFVTLSTRHVMSLKLRDEKITHQIDYVDYTAFSRQIKELQLKHGKTTQ